MGELTEDRSEANKIQGIEDLYHSLIGGFANTMYRKFVEQEIIEGEVIANTETDSIGYIKEATAKVESVIANERSNPFIENAVEIQNLKDFVGLLYSVASALKLEDWSTVLDILMQLNKRNVFRNQDTPIWNVLKEEFKAPGYLNDTKVANEAVNKMKSYKIQVLPYVSWLLEYLSLTLLEDHLSDYEFEKKNKVFNGGTVEAIDFIGLSYASSIPDILVQVEYKRKNVDEFNDVLIQTARSLKEYNNSTKKENVLILFLYNASEDEINFDKIKLRFNKTVEGQFPDFAGRIIYLPLSTNRFNALEGELLRLKSTLSQIRNRVKVIFREVPYLISKEENFKISSDFISKPIGSFATWIRVPPAKEISQEIENNRYVIAHDTQNGNQVNSRYLNAWGLALSPKIYHKAIDNAVRWKMWSTNDIGEDYNFVAPEEWQFPETEWHHFLIRWNHNKPSLELLIDGKSIDIRNDYFNAWPKKFNEYMRLGIWTNGHPRHDLGMPLYRVITSENYLSDIWLSNEIGKYKPHPSFSYKNDQVILRDMSTLIMPVDEFMDDFLILNAEYGYGQHFNNVTFQIRKMIQNRSLIFSVSNERFGDPFPGSAKQLIVSLNVHGKKQTISIDEHATVDFNNYK
jgi:hypothetical protein